MNRNNNETLLVPFQQVYFPQRLQCVFCFLSQAKEKYEKSLEELNKCTPQYMESMEQVFDQCQQHEVKRLTFLKEALLDIKRHLNLTENQRLARLTEPVLFMFHRAAGFGSLAVFFPLTYDLYCMRGKVMVHCI